MDRDIGKIPKRIRLTPAELYYLIQVDRGIWEKCEAMEKALSELQSLPAEVLRARLSILIGLVFGSTRAELIEKVSDAGYRRSYAEKIIDEAIKSVKGLLGGGPIFRIAVEPEPVKGQFTKPYSRAYSRLGRPERGRPPVKYELEEHRMTRLSRRMRELIDLVTFLSGSSLRYQELQIKIFIEIVRRPELRKIFLEVLEREYSIPPDNIRKFEENIDNFVKQAEERLRSYNNLRNELVGSMQKEIHKILGLSPPPEKEQEKHLKTPHPKHMIVDAIVARATRIFKPLLKLHKEKQKPEREA